MSLEGITDSMSGLCTTQQLYSVTADFRNNYIFTHNKLLSILQKYWKYSNKYRNEQQVKRVI